MYKYGEINGQDLNGIIIMWKSTSGMENNFHQICYTEGHVTEGSTVPNFLTINPSFNSVEDQKLPLSTDLRCHH